jgi:uncharacterized protein YciI
VAEVADAATTHHLKENAMYIIFLRFGANRAQAAQWMAGHAQWIQQGIDDGVFLLAGSLDNAQGGALLAAGVERAALEERIGQDPFVAHGVVSAEIHAVAPSRMAPAMAALLERA